MGFFQAIDRVLGREEKQDFLFFDDLELLFASSDEARSADKPWQLPSYTFVQPPTTLQYQQHQGTCFGNQTVYLPQACQDVKVKIMSFPKSGRTWFFFFFFFFFVLFCFVLFYFILFCFILFYFILFLSFLFFSLILFHFQLSSFPHPFFPLPKKAPMHHLCHAPQIPGRRPHIPQSSCS